MTAGVMSPDAGEKKMQNSLRTQGIK